MSCTIKACMYAAAPIATQAEAPPYGIKRHYIIYAEGRSYGLIWPYI